MRAIDILKTSLELILLLVSLLLCLGFACWFLLRPTRRPVSGGDRGFALRLHRHQPG